jgi:iron(III) transport system substrate-binding protein
MKLLKPIWLLPVIAITINACGGGQQGSQDSQGEQNQDTAKQQEKLVNVYSHRHYEVDEALYEQFEKNTGIEVNVVNASADQLMKKLEMEGKKSPADVLISVDAGRLHRAKEKGLLQSVSNDTLNKRVPKRFRDPKGYWYGLTYRARAIAYDKNDLEKGAIKTYEGLADDQWKDRILIRSSQNIYNQSLIASVLAHKGKKATKQWLNGLVDNFARKPQGGDRDQIKAVASGKGDIAVVNTYYLAKMLQSKNQAEVKAAKTVNLVFPNQDGRGSHINISGAGVTKHAPHKENAVKLIQFLTSKKAQHMYASRNYEFPVRKDVQLPSLLQEWKGFKKDSLDLSKLGKYHREAVKMADQAGWR